MKFSKEKIQFVVVNENIFAYHNPKINDENSLEYMSCKCERRPRIIKGTADDKSFLIHEKDQIRKADKKDFEEFRVSSGGYEDDRRIETILERDLDQFIGHTETLMNGIF